MKKRAILIIFILCSFFLYAKEKYDLRYAIDATEKIIEAITTKKLVFISENHDEVYPLYYLSKNLLSFYNAGVRYLFLEEETDNYIDNPENLNLFIFPPWQQQGSKIQYQLFEDKINEINKIHKDDPIIVVWPETGAKFEEGDWNDTHTYMNKRDMQAQKTIIKIMDNTDKKGLIFYGSGHGQKEPLVWDSTSKEPFWIPTGYYLNKHYGEAFCSFVLFDFSSTHYRNVLYKNGDDVKILPDDYLNIILNEDDETKKYDFYCAYSCGVSAVPSVYVPTSYNLGALLRKISQNRISSETKIDSWSEKSEQLLAIYFLKYHYGKKFNYNLMDSEEELHNAILELQKEEIPNISYDLKMLEEYMSFLYGVSYSPTRENFLFCMKKAEDLNPKDIWALYWIAFEETKEAEEKNSKRKYKKALSSWNKLFQNELLLSSPVLKLSCQKATQCAEKAKDKEKMDYYRDLESKINPLFDIDYKNYDFFGY